MRFSIVSIALIAASFSVTEAQIARQLKKGKSDKKTNDRKTARRNALIGNCSALANTSFEVETGYLLDDQIIYTYPCSGSYLRYFGSNYNLLRDVYATINKKGREMGIDADCATLCDIDNGSFDTVEKNGEGSLFGLENSDIFCDPDDGILNDRTQIRNNDFDNPSGGNACDCDPAGGYVAGCLYCYGKVTFRVNTCLDSSTFTGTR